MIEDLVIIYLRFPEGKLDNERSLNAIFKLEELLANAVESEYVGWCDGNEIGLNVDEVRFFFYGSNANKIYDLVFPIIAKLPKFVVSSIDKHYNRTNYIRS